MKYQKMVNLSDNTPNQPAKFKTKYFVQINSESRGTYGKDNQIRFKTSMLRLLYEIISMHTYLLKEL